MSEETTTPKPQKEKRTKEEILEIIIAIFLGVTALTTAWASWIGDLHGGNQATSYTESTNLSASGNAQWNEASQSLVQDMQIWNQISDYEVEILYASSIGDADQMSESAYKIQYICLDNMTEEMAELIGYDFSFEAEDIIDWVINDENSTTSPFTNMEYVESYYAEATATLAESQAKLESGNQSNTYGDSYGLVTVIYSVVLFMLGIVGTFKNLPNRYIVTAVALIGFIFATIYMCTIPLPDGFSLLSFFGV